MHHSCHCQHQLLQQLRMDRLCPYRGSSRSRRTGNQHPSLQTEKEYQYGSFEQRHIDIVSSIKKQISIPVIVKLGSNLTNPIALINQLYANGANAVVLFNRFYQPDINIDTMTYSAGDVFSTPADLSNGLRWTAIASAQVPQTDYAISGGVHDGKAIVKAILAALPL